MFRIPMSVALLVIGCGGGSAEQCLEDTAASATTPMTIDGSFQGYSFAADCGLASCWPPEVEFATVRCYGGDVAVEGAAATGDDPSLDSYYQLDVEVYLPGATTAGSQTFLSDDGHNGGVWVSPGGANYTGAHEDAVANAVDVIAFTPGERAVGTYNASWGGAFPIVVTGSFDVSCVDATD